MSKQSLNIKIAQQKIKNLLKDFEKSITNGNLRAQVLSLIPVVHELRNIGKALIPVPQSTSARDRILYYFKKYPNTIINSEELLVVSAIQEYARRIRELRVQFGWNIISGVTAKEIMEESGDADAKDISVLSKMGPDDYLMLSSQQDTNAAYRWHVANEIRKKNIGTREKIKEYFLKNVGKKVSGEELRYLAKDASEWARRVRELRTEYGWQIQSKHTGRPDLPIGVYVLESKEQLPEHDRKIPDQVRFKVLERDNYTCVKCGWNQKKWHSSAPRHLELHHKKEHSKGGKNEEENLITVCNVCHDEIHRKTKKY